MEKQVIREKPNLEVLDTEDLVPDSSFCPFCGSELVPKACFCGNCGVDLADESSDVAPDGELIGLRAEVEQLREKKLKRELELGMSLEEYNQRVKQEVKVLESELGTSTVITPTEKLTTIYYEGDPVYYYVIKLRQELISKKLDPDQLFMISDELADTKEFSPLIDDLTSLLELLSKKQSVISYELKDYEVSEQSIKDSILSFCNDFIISYIGEVIDYAKDLSEGDSYDLIKKLNCIDKPKRILKSTKGLSKKRVYHDYLKEIGFDKAKAFVKSLVVDYVTAELSDDEAINLGEQLFVFEDLLKAVDNDEVSEVGLIIKKLGFKNLGDFLTNKGFIKKVKSDFSRDREFFYGNGEFNYFFNKKLAKKIAGYGFYGGLMASLVYLGASVWSQTASASVLWAVPILCSIGPLVALGYCAVPKIRTALSKIKYGLVKKFDGFKNTRDIKYCLRAVAEAYEKFSILNE